jgi:Flp pilus assembly pilin Flp
MTATSGHESLAGNADFTDMTLAGWKNAHTETGEGPSGVPSAHVPANVDATAYFPAHVEDSSTSVSLPSTAPTQPAPLAASPTIAQPQPFGQVGVGAGSPFGSSAHPFGQSAEQSGQSGHSFGQVSPFQPLTPPAFHAQQPHVQQPYAQQQYAQQPFGQQPYGSQSFQVQPGYASAPGYGYAPGQSGPMGPHGQANAPMFVKPQGGSKAGVIVAVILVLFLLVPIMLIGAVSVLGSKLKSNFNNISNTLPYNTGYSQNPSAPVGNGVLPPIDPNVGPLTPFETVSGLQTYDVYKRNATGPVAFVAGQNCAVFEPDSTSYSAVYCSAGKMNAQMVKRGWPLDVQ